MKGLFKLIAGNCISDASTNDAVDKIEKAKLHYNEETNKFEVVEKPVHIFSDHPDPEKSTQYQARLKKYQDSYTIEQVFEKLKAKEKEAEWQLNEREALAKTIEQQKAEIEGLKDGIEDQKMLIEALNAKNKNQSKQSKAREKELREALKGSQSLMEQSLLYRKANNITLGLVFLESQIQINNELLTNNNFMTKWMDDISTNNKEG